MSLRSEMILDAKLIMRDGLMRLNPAAVIDEFGYVKTWQLNLLPELDPRLLEPDFRSGKGSELDRKFRAAHSSAALVANVFGPFRGGVTPFIIPGVGETRLDRFERTYPTGVVGRTPPHLDASASGPRGVVAIESKCIEYFTRKTAEFSLSYRTLEHLRTNPWFIEMERLREVPRDYQCLDAAQLVKHAFGLLHSVGQGATLLYLFWEPDDAERHDLFTQHRSEIAALQARIRDGGVSLIPLSYPELWKAWHCSESAQIQKHAEELRIRYSGCLGSYEGYTRVDGRKLDGNFFSDID